MNLRRARWPIAVTLLSTLMIVAVASRWVWATTETNIYQDMQQFNQIVSMVAHDYVDDIDFTKMIHAGIRGMLETLDPHTQFFEEKQLDRLMEDTKGEFEGIGAQIGEQDNMLAIISPIEGSPAERLGIQAGDIILKINGKTTRGMKSDDAVKVIRGPKGTSVTLTIGREGESEPMDYTITRDVITVHSVPFYGMIDGDVGYVRLARFSENTEAEMTEALQSLNGKGAKSLVFDLRDNPGGLLNEAVATANLFLERGKLVVYTQGHDAESRREYRCSHDPIWPATKRVCILVSPGSASASEIVAGALQDWDRAVVAGQVTYGKGLVQQVRRLPNSNLGLKITTAKYYIPSDRCVQKENYITKASAIKRPGVDSTSLADDMTSLEGEVDADGNPIERTDTLKPVLDAKGNPIPRADSTKKVEGKVYLTKASGRKVYGGGGVTPDVKLDVRRFNRLEIELVRKQHFFGFANHYTAEHKNLDRTFKISDAVMDQFRAYIKDKKFDYKSSIDLQIEQLEKVMKDEKIDDAGLKTEVDALKREAAKAKDTEFGRSRDFVEDRLLSEVGNKLYGEKGRYEMGILTRDPDVVRATQILHEGNEYAARLVPSK